MKITMFELLEMVKDGKAPKKIKYENREYYLYDNKSYLTTDKTRFFDRVYFSDLNVEIEILEEEKKALTLNDIRESYSLPRIEEKKIPEKLDVIAYEKCIHDVTHKEKQLALEIRETQIAFNEIIDYLDYLKSKGDE